MEGWDPKRPKICSGLSSLGAMAHPDFVRSVNPISTMGNRLCPPIYYWHTRIFRPSNGPDADVIGMLEPRYLSTMVLGHKNQFKSSLLFESNKIQWILFYWVSRLKYQSKILAQFWFPNIFWPPEGLVKVWYVPQKILQFLQKPNLCFWGLK